MTPWQNGTTHGKSQATHSQSPSIYRSIGPEDGVMKWDSILEIWRLLHFGRGVSKIVHDNINCSWWLCTPSNLEKVMLQKILLYRVSKFWHILTSNYICFVRTHLSLIYHRQNSHASSPSLEFFVTYGNSSSNVNNEVVHQGSHPEVWQTFDKLRKG